MNNQDREQSSPVQPIQERQQSPSTQNQQRPSALLASSGPKYPREGIPLDQGTPHA